jgi:hypothetical protein
MQPKGHFRFPEELGDVRDYADISWQDLQWLPTYASEEGAVSEGTRHEG